MEHAYNGFVDKTSITERYVSLFLAFPSIAAQPLLLRPHFVTKTSTWETSNFSSVKENRLHRPISRGFRTTLPHAEDYRTPPKYTLSV